jgi:predicted methyltransferase
MRPRRIAVDRHRIWLAMHLPAHSLDAVLLIKVYHDLYWVGTEEKWPTIDVDSVLTQLAGALKPGGRLLLVGHSAKEGTGSASAMPLHRIEEAYAVKDLLTDSKSLQRVIYCAAPTMRGTR